MGIENHWTALHYNNRNYLARCRICTNDNVAPFTELPFADTIIEDELHVLRCCPVYEHLRASLSPNIKCLLWNDNYLRDLFHMNNVRETSKFIHEVMKIRYS